MKTSKFASLSLAAFLHFSPIASRAVQAMPVFSACRVAIVLQWVVGALAVAGTYHTVSAATAALQSPSTIQGTVGTTLSYQIRIVGPNVGFPQSWTVDGQNFNSSGSTTAGMPPGLTMSLTTGIIRGSPTEGGSFPVTITAYENRNERGHSITFTLTFNIAGGVAPPTITTQPTGGTVMAGSSFTFTVVAAGSGLAYQWQHGESDLPGATSSSLILNSVTLADAGNYTVAVSNSAGTLASDVATLTVTPAFTPTTITVQPAGASLHAGETLNISVTATGPGALKYQWQKEGTPLADQTNPNLTIASVTSANAGSYTVVVTGSDATVTSSAAAVAVVPLLMKIQQLSSGGATIVMGAIPGRQYTVEATDTLSGTNWQTVGTATASSETVLFVDPSSPTAGQRFWRYRPAL
jgi:hypothetical protein